LLIENLARQCSWYSIKNQKSTVINHQLRQSMTPTEKPTEARRFLVRGRVQGVGFRWFVEREAHILGIAGWVRNNHDGSVEILAQGTRDQLSGLHSRLREGPRAARVDAVEVSDAPPAAGLSSFRIEGAW
jgi:acylphosphatase